MFSPQNISVLYVEHDSSLRKSTTSCIRDEGYTVFLADTSMSAYDTFQTHKIDIIIVDCKSENNNELELIRHLREKDFLLPVIITISQTNKQLLLEAINLDISRCLVKPYTNKELLEALEIASKKVLFCHPMSSTDLKNGFHYNPVSKSIITPNERLVQLSKKEYLLIELLLHNKGKIIPYSIIERAVWDDRPMSMDSLRTLVGGIRKKTHTDIISNHNGTGYKIDS
ncbi:MAG: response regulator [Sulfuricurvum sp.]|nr:response regulator [Sulfuricurvum sp.]